MRETGERRLENHAKTRAKIARKGGGGNKGFLTLEEKV